NYLNETISSGHTRLSLIKLSAILHDIGKPSALKKRNGKFIFHGHERIGSFKTEEIARRLKLSVDEINALHKIVALHLRPGFLADAPKLTSRAKFRFFRDTGKEAISVILLSLADQRATRGRLTTKDSRQRHEKTCKSLIKEYFKKQKEKKPCRIITGDDLITEFKLQPSPLVGKILSEIEELQAIGRISTKLEAFEVARKIISKERK
ncbi:MAG: HD domain-containing protein, partial [Candidatus Omnitrophica bacterium]|nr:HD domain-containing protein [Candidatus Omnitrophota bacterium]